MSEDRAKRLFIAAGQAVERFVSEAIAKGYSRLEALRVLAALASDKEELSRFAEDSGLPLKRKGD